VEKPKVDGGFGMLKETIELSAAQGLFAALLVAVLALSGCAGAKMKGPPLATLAGVPGHFGIGQILDLKAGKSISFDEFIEALSSRDLLFIGEIHDNPEHHLIQIQILQALVDRCGSLTLAMEFFQRPHQEILDRYVKGELSESDFLEAIDWRRSWGYAYHLYRPLLLAAREKSMRILAINAPAAIVRKVARNGLQGLSDDERSQVAAEIDLNDREHRDYLLKAYQEHTHQDLKRFQDFYEAQCVWEETMAESLADYMKGQGGKVVVFAGNGHLIHKFGIPARTSRRTGVAVATVIPYPLLSREEVPRDASDFIWLTAHYPHRPLWAYDQNRASVRR